MSCQITRHLSTDIYVTMPVYTRTSFYLFDPSHNKKYFDYVTHVKCHFDIRKTWKNHTTTKKVQAVTLQCTFMTVADMFHLSIDNIPKVPPVIWRKNLQGWVAAEPLVIVHDILWSLRHNSCMQVYRGNGGNSQITCAAVSAVSGLISPATALGGGLSGFPKWWFFFGILGDPPPRVSAHAQHPSPPPNFRKAAHRCRRRRRFFFAFL